MHVLQYLLEGWYNPDVFLHT